MKYDNDTIERIRAIPIADMLGVQMVSRYKMIQCPFHDDSSPSFKLNDDNSFYCFGCDAVGWNFIDFLLLGPNGNTYSFNQIYDEFKNG